jgi:hypothetical protein
MDLPGQDWKPPWAAISGTSLARSSVPADGPFWPYLKAEKVHLCPTFNVLAKSEGARHPSHDPANPIDPYYSYSMNAFLGSTNGTTPGGVLKRSRITRSAAEVFFFAEENMWARPGCSNVLNDNALCGDGRDWFGTFHGAKQGDWNGGVINLVFVDAHVESTNPPCRSRRQPATSLPPIMAVSKSSLIVQKEP